MFSDLPFVFAFILLEGVLSADLEFRQNTHTSPSLSLAILADSDNSSCGTFDEGTGPPWVTDFNLPVLNVNPPGEYSVSLSGRNMGCEESDDGKLYVILVSEASRMDVLGRTETCQLVTATPGDPDTCEYSCSCHGKCDAIRFVRRPIGNHFMTWQMCTLTALVFAPASCMVATGTDGGGFFTHWDRVLKDGRFKAIRFLIYSGQITGIQATYNTTTTQWIGQEGSDADPQATLLEGETFNSATIYKGVCNGWPCVAGLSLGTSSGRLLGPYGEVTSDVTQGSGSELLYLSGRSGAIVDKLLLHFIDC